ncbi:hypothetical protein [Chondromyces apiculatus]|uniref:Uncharacterized protein n=1 Tax=Chondromyces apiculatus DSM 436 TaxID=1192034 RepID=A0A017T2Q7_9BACT|nr:hypothetical protein [Chondromyces apiculatus]EYF03513.1 Hypothetical protein CAP_5497 [Chondromyces apiculatus DSM 436]
MTSPRAFLAALTLGAVLLSVDSARAQQVQTVERWYGWQNLIGAGVSGGVIVTGTTTKTDAVTFVGLGAFAVSGPIIHLAHGRPVAAGGALALNVLVPTLTTLAGGGICLLGCDDWSHDTPDFMRAGLVAGMLFATVMDVAVLSHEEERTSVGVAAPGSEMQPERYTPLFHVGGRF